MTRLRRFTRRLTIALITSLGMISTLAATTNPIDFQDEGESRQWRVINDTVMGGRSQSLTMFEEGYTHFCGMLSLENNGGFASVRRLWSPDESANGQKVALRFMGDGRRYQLRFRTNRRWDGVSYTATFQTERGQWSEVSFTEDDFRPTFRGWTVRDARPFRFSDVEQVGLMLADKSPGAFCLSLDRLWLTDS